MVEQSRDYALFILDPSGRIMSWNLGAEWLKGYAADEIIGRHFSTFYTREAVESGDSTDAAPGQEAPPVK